VHAHSAKGVRSSGAMQPEVSQFGGSVRARGHHHGQPQQPQNRQGPRDPLHHTRGHLRSTGLPTRRPHRVRSERGPRRRAGTTDPVRLPASAPGTCAIRKRTTRKLARFGRNALAPRVRRTCDTASRTVTGPWTRVLSTGHFATFVASKPSCTHDCLLLLIGVASALGAWRTMRAVSALRQFEPGDLDPATAVCGFVDRPDDSQGAGCFSHSDQGRVAFHDRR
jgi:hypothetical protein